MALAQALPQGGQVVAGAATIAKSGPGQMVVDQASAQAVIDWQGFSIGPEASVRFQQPGPGAAALNRVTGKQMSRLDGQLAANGQVFLINPNGIAIGPQGRINTGSFTASTLALSDEDFLSGNLVFRGDGASKAVTNAGQITATRGGFVALLGGRVENSGYIAARLGKVGLGAGEQVTLDLAGDGFLQVALPSADPSDAALIDNSGTIAADGGTVVMRAATAKNAVRHAINLSGIAEAKTVSGRSGAVILGGGAGGQVRVSGRAAAPAPPPPTAAPQGYALQVGGRIEITGAQIAVTGTLDARGAAGGGDIFVGGGWQGAGDLPWADIAYAGPQAVLDASALGSGDGGTVVLWSSDTTAFAGSIFALGGAQGGNGGAAEVSGPRLSFAGNVDLTATAGATGTLLLDPFDVTVSTRPTTQVPAPIAFEEDTAFLAGAPLAAVADTTSPSQFEPFQSGFNINTADLQNALGKANVAVKTTSAFGSSLTQGNEPGDISVEDPVAWDAATSLTLLADNDIVVDGAITATRGSIDMHAGQSLPRSGAIEINAPLTADQGDIHLLAYGPISIDAAISAPAGTFEVNTNRFREVISATGDVAVDTFVLAGGAWRQVQPVLPGFSANDFKVDAGQGESFLRATGGDGSAGDPYQIADIYGLQGIDSSVAAEPSLDLLSKSFVLTADIDASGTANWNGGQGFDPIGEDRDDLSAGQTVIPFTGNLDGAGFSITDLRIARPKEDSVGLFAIVAEPATGTGGVISDLVLSNADVSGRDDVGLLFGVGSGSTQNVSVDGAVRGAGGGIGGVGGVHGGLAQNVIASPIDVRSGVGFDTSVQRQINTGGLFGEERGVTRQAKAEGRVLVTGFNPGSVPVAVNAGGLFGATTTSADGADLVSEVDVESRVTAANTSVQLAGIAADHAGALANAFAAGQMQASPTAGSTTIAGALGARGAPGTASDVFWDTEATGSPTSAGGVGLTTAELQSAGFAAQAPGWDFANVWVPGAQGFYPALQAVEPVVSAVADDLVVDQTAALPGATGTLTGAGNYALGPAGDTIPTAGVFSHTVADTSSFGDFAITTAPTVTSAQGTTYRVVGTPGTLTVNQTVPVQIPVQVSLQDIEVTVGDPVPDYGATLTFTPIPGLTPPDPPLSTGPSGTSVEGTYPIELLGTTIPPQSVGGIVYEYSFSIVQPAVLKVNPQNPPPAPIKPTQATTQEMPDPSDAGLAGDGADAAQADDIQAAAGQTAIANSPSEQEAAEETLAAVSAAGAQVEVVAAACRQSAAPLSEDLDCVAAALDRYADALEDLETELPEPLRGVSAVIREARREVQAVRVRSEAALAATTDPQERAAISQAARAEASASIQRARSKIADAILLVRAEDPLIGQIERAQGAAISAALQVVDVELVRASGI